MEALDAITKALSLVMDKVVEMKDRVEVLKDRVEVLEHKLSEYDKLALSHLELREENERLQGEIVFINDEWMKDSQKLIKLQHSMPF